MAKGNSRKDAFQLSLFMMGFVLVGLILVI